MAKVVKELKDTKCSSAKPLDDKDYYLFDGNGLRLKIAKKTGTKTWYYFYGKTSKIAIGRYPALSLLAARDKRREFEAMLANGLDPKEQLELAKIKKENAHSLEKVTRAWHAEVTSKEQWGDDTGKKTMRKFENHLFPLIGHMPIEEVEPLHIAKAITAIDQKGVNRVARDIKANLVRIFSYAIQNGYVRHNPAREMDGVVIAKKKKHYPQLKHECLPNFFQRIDNYCQTVKKTRQCSL